MKTYFLAEAEREIASLKAELSFYRRTEKGQLRAQNRDLLAALPDPDKLETLAAWLDIDDVALRRGRRKKADESWVQDDLREWARLARAVIAADAKGEGK